ncbi:MAG TPA: hypothetical protein VG889_21200 [Rhizomicrobium sp.]|nr:hypothetical protein [Rhizomicrobium sp.]
MPVSAKSTAWLALALSALAAFSLTGGAASGVVSAASDPATPRFHQTALLLGDNRVLIAGGMRANGAVEASAELYDPAASRFLPLPGMHVARVGAVAARLPNGDVLIAGGSDGRSCLSSAEIYDAAHRRFRSGVAMHVPRCSAQAFVLKNGAVLVAGGSTSSDDGQLATAELYDPRIDAFTQTGSLRVPRSAFAGAVLRDGRVLVTGGWSAGTYPARTIEKSAEIYDPANGRFSPAGSMTVERYKMAAVRLKDGRVLVIGGSDARDWQGISNTTEIYDPATRRFTAAAFMRFARFKLPDGAVLLDDGKVLVVGGAARAEIYDPAANAFAPAGGVALDGFYFSTATKLANDQTLIVGGCGEDPGAGAVRHAWLYRP